MLQFIKTKYQGDDMEFRKANTNDIAKIVDLRLKLLKEEGAFIETKADVEKLLFEYYEKELNKTITVNVAEQEGEIVSMSGLIFQQYPPSFKNPTGLKAHISSVYTVPAFRRKGLATKLLDTIVEQVKQNGVKDIWLLATKQGVPLYEKYGFEKNSPSKNMTYTID